jgi:cyclophilin family peptidyl-prolyl cis-trans isomerase
MQSAKPVMARLSIKSGISHRYMSVSSSSSSSSILASSRPLPFRHLGDTTSEGARPPRLPSVVLSTNVNTAPAGVFPASHHAIIRMSRRYFGSGGGSRGARGHGWWINYRAGKGGRHLQGEYSHLDVDALEAWNDAVLSLGSQLVYMDIQSEAMSSTSSASATDQKSNQGGDKEASIPIHRLKIQLATAVLPKATENFIKLVQAEAGVGYKTSTLHRVEKRVGMMGGLVWKGGATSSNNRKAPAAIGKCHPDLRMTTSLTSMDVESEALVLSHLPGVVTMLMPRVHEVDSRFFICSHHAPHLDGKAVAIGRLADVASLETIQQWEGSLITQMGKPTNVNLRIVDCGLLMEEEEETVASSNTTNDATNESAAEEKRQAAVPQ